MRLDPEKVQLLLRRRDLNQTELAKMAGVSRQTLNRVVSGQRSNDRTSTKIADALGVPVEALLPSDNIQPMEAATLSGRERALLEIFRQLPVERQYEVIGYVRGRLDGLPDTASIVGGRVLAQVGPLQSDAGQRPPSPARPGSGDEESVPGAEDSEGVSAQDEAGRGTHRDRRRV